MKGFLLFFIVIVVANCSSINSVKELIGRFDYNDAAADALRNATKTLIAETRIEFDDLTLLTEREIALTTDAINENINKILSYAVSRTTNLVSDLLEEIQTAQIYQTDYSACLITLPFLKTFNNSYRLTDKLSVTTGVRIANTTIRQSAATMKSISARLESYESVLTACADSDLTCILGVSTGVVQMNDDFMASSNQINENISNLAAQVLSQVNSYANHTVYRDEDYVCANADLIQTCIKTFNDDEARDVTTTVNTDPTTTTSPTTTTDQTTISSDGTTVTAAPKITCTHEPFNPPLYF